MLGRGGNRPQREPRRYDSMTTAQASAARSDTRREIKVAPNLYRQVGTDRYRFAKMANGVSVFERFTSPTLTEAKAYADTLRTRKPSSFGDKSVTIEALAKSYLERESGRHAKASARTVELRRSLLTHHVVPALGPRTKAVDVDAASLRRMIEKLNEEGLSGSTVRGCVSSASALLRHGVKDLGALPRNPARDLDRGDRPSAKRQTEPRYLSVGEVGQLLDNLSDETRPIAAACFWGALRVSEALRLTWGDIDATGRKVNIPGSKTEASKATIPLLPQLANELRAHRERQAARGFDRIAMDALVFSTASGRSPLRRNVLRAVTNAAKRAGLQPEGAEPVGVHDLRHSFAAYALGGGLSLLETSRVLRHANPQITATVYAGMSDEAVTALGSKLEAIGQAR
jgi:integrase